MGKFKKNVNTKNKSSQSITVNKSRKLLRKEKRNAKKERKNEHIKNKIIWKNNIKSQLKNKASNNINSIRKETVTLQHEKKQSVKKPPVKKVEPTYLEQQYLDHKKEIQEHKQLLKQMNAQRSKQLLDENIEEDIVIKKLEKQLLLKKRKSNTIPKIFVEEGLDYLLEVCDKDKMKGAITAEMNLQDASSDFEEDFAVIKGNNKKKIKNIVKTKENYRDESISESSENDESDNSSDLDDCNSIDDYDDDEDFEDDEVDSQPIESGRNSNKKIQPKNIKKNMKNFDNNDDSEFDEEDFSGSLSDEEDEEGDSVNNNDSEGELHEDIYGRKRDKHGAVIPDEGKYIPPHLKAQMIGNSGRMELLTRLRRQIKGLLNRLAESNMYSIASQIDQLYMQNSRNDMNDTLTKLTLEAIIQPALASERLVVEHTMLIAVLHANVGTEVGAHFLQVVIEKFDSMYKAGLSVANKEVDNILLIVAYLYNFKLFNCVLIFDILNRLTDTKNFDEKEVELLLIVLRQVGFNLRKDNPVALKNTILKVQSIVNSSSELSDRSRVRFMLDILTAIKNNNTTKIPNYDPSQIEHHKKTMKSLIHKGKYISELNISLDDLLKAPEQGKWWVVGSAWSGGEVSKSLTDKDDSNTAENNIDRSYIVLAKKHRMNTDTRQNIFCILMSAEDYMDAFEKLLRLGLKGSQEQTILHVIVHCALQEKIFNPYYSYVAERFCTLNRKHQMTLQYHVWDRLKQLDVLKGFQITNLALFLAHLILEKALPLSVLKIIGFASLTKPQVRLLRRIFLTILLHNNNETVTEVFQRISKTTKLKLFRESIRLFFHHFILKNINEGNDEMTRLKERVLVAEKSMHFV